MLFFICILTSVAQLLPSLWLSKWVDEQKEAGDEQTDNIYPAVFGILIAVFLIFTLLRSFTLFKIILSSASNLQNTITNRILRANVSFFDQNSIGRIL